MYRSSNKDFKQKILCAMLNKKISVEAGKKIFARGVNIPISEWVADDKPNIDALKMAGVLVPDYLTIVK